jgi:subtilase family serine protease
MKTTRNFLLLAVVATLAPLTPAALLAQNHPPEIVVRDGGHALRLDGTNDYVANASGAFGLRSNLTVTAWFRNTDDFLKPEYNGQPMGNYLLSKGVSSIYGGPYNDYVFTLSPDRRVSFTIAREDQTQFSVVTLPLPDVPHHFAGVYDFDHSRLRLYVDGQLAGETSATGRLRNYADNLFIGDWNGNSSWHFHHGEIDEVRLWNVARSEADIRREMRFQLTTNEPGLVAYWAFDEASGTTAVDQAPNGSNGTLVNGPLRLASPAPHFAPALATNSGLAQITVTLQGSDPDNDPITAYLTQWPAFGRLFQTTDGVTLGAAITAVPTAVTSPSRQVIYRRLPGYTGIDDLQYFVSDGQTNSETATVSLDVVAPSGEEQCIPVPPGIVAWWKGDGTATDSAGTNNGVLTNGATYGLGVVGQAFGFDGVDDYVSTPPEALYSIHDNFTMEFWVCPTAGRTTTPEASSGISGTGGQRYAIAPGHVGGSAGAGAGVSVGTNGISVFEHADTFLPSPLVYVATIQGWHHVAVTYQDRRPTLFLDGVPVRTGLQSSRAFVFPSAVLGNVGNYGPFSGFLDEPSIYNRALLSTEIAAIYSAGSAGKCGRICTPPPLGTTAWWPGEGNAGDVIGGNNGSLVGQVSFGAGVVGQAFQFNGNGRYAVPESPALRFGQESFTLQFWVKPASFAGGYDPNSGIRLLDKARSYPSTWWVVDFLPGGAVEMEMIGANSVGGTTHSDGVLPLNQWTHVAIVVDRPNFRTRYYLNGQPDSSKSFPPAFTGHLDVAGSDLYIGSQYNAFKGGLDEFSVCKRALSDAEIAAVYAAGSAGMCATGVPATLLSQPPSQVAILGETVSFTVTASGGYPLAFQWRFNDATLAGATAANLILPDVQAAQAGLYSVVVTNPWASVTSQWAVLTVITNIPDLRPSLLASAPTNAPGGSLVTVSWVTTNAGNATANAPWQESLSLANNPAGTNATPLVVLTAGTSLATEGSLARTQSVIVPDGLVGTHWLVVRVDSANAVAEGYGETNNWATVPLAIASPDLVAADVRPRHASGLPAAAATFGESLTVSWTVTNAGTGPAGGSWSDRVWLSSVSNSLAGATLLGSAAEPAALPPGGSYTNAATITVPFTTQSQPGSYWLIVQTDGGGTVGESDEANNLRSVPLALTLPPLPDLGVGLVSSPASAVPGQTVMVTWAVTNLGPASVTNGVWQEALSLTNMETGGTPVLLSTFTFTNTLAAGDSLLRTQAVTIPVTGVAGDCRVLVQVDSADALVEASETNNVAWATNTLHVPQGLSLYLPVTQIAEDAANPAVSGLVSRNGNLAGPVTVALAVDIASQVSVPATVTIPAGQASAAFSLTVLRNPLVTGNRAVTLTASATNYDGASAALTVLDADRPTLTVQAQTPMAEGTTASATVTRDVVTAQELTVALGSSSASRLGVPAVVVIPAGSNGVSFTVSAVENSFVEGPRSLMLTAAATGFNSGSAPVTVLDNDWPVLRLTLASWSVSEGAGPGATFGSVRRSVVTDQPLAVALESSNTLAAVVPQGVVIPAGQLEVIFPIATVSDGVVTGAKPALISAWFLDSITGARLGTPVAQLLTVLDQDGPTLQVAIARKVVAEALTNAATGTVTRNTPATNALVVALASSLTTAALVPATVTIPAGQASASFNISSLNDGVTHGNQTVTITAAADSYTSGSDWLLVTDINLPDLVAENVTGPATAATESYVSLGYRLANRGLASASGAIVQRVWLSTNPYLAGAQELARLTNSGTLPVDGWIERTVTVRLPLQTGDYWVLVEVDPDNTLAENNEANNVGVSAARVHVEAAYGATVQTAVTLQTTTAPVPLSGSATRLGGGPAALVPVSIHLGVRGTERVISAITDAAGNFATAFIPLPGEAGHYFVGATHPGVSGWTTNDDFAILGLRVTPATASLLVVEGGTKSGSVALENQSDLPLSGLSATVLDASANLLVTPTLDSSGLAGAGQIGLHFSVQALNASVPRALATVRVTSAEGVTTDLTLYVTVEALRANLVAQPAALTAGMVRGGQALVEFDVVNTGGTNSGPVQVVVPQLAWLRVASTNPLPSLAPGQTNRVTLLLSPALDLALGPYAGTLVLQGTSASAAVPFDFRALSDAVGTVQVSAVDEYTYYAAGAPKVTNATVTLSDAVAGTNVASGVTGPDGNLLLTNVPEAYYILEVQAPGHNGWRATVLVLGGQANAFEAFLSRQTVKYTWTVVPTEIEDRTRITIETTFETVVPIPVVTVEPNLIDLASVTGPQTQIDVTVANHGLVAAKDARLSFPAHPCWELKPLIEALGDIPAQGSVTVPVVIRRLSSSGCAPCQFTGGVTWTLRCANRVNSYFVPIQVINAGHNCGGAVVIGGSSGGPSSGSSGWVDGGSSSSSSSGNSATYVPPNIVVNTNCDCAARVKLMIDQQAVISRDAFKATLEVVNGVGVPMTGVRVDVFVRNRAGEDVTGLFAIRDPLLTGLTNVTGQGVLAGNATGQVDWIIIPTVDAAPTVATDYFVGGTLTYSQGGQYVTVPLAPTSITVLPLAQLNVKYFHERDVFADDPFTPQVEPSVPFNLAVMLQNTGAGVAKNARITSAQPQIVENESGLLIDFKIIATEVSGSNLVPSLTADFGTITNGEIKVGRWLLQATLQGLFLDYKASFEHQDALGNKRIAIITNVEIHELIHLVRDARPGADALPDFLVNDVPDPNDRPDTLHLSDGRLAPVSVVESGTFGGVLGGGNLQVTLTAALPGGWTYLRVPDPGTSLYRLVGVVRSDGVALGLGTNAWATDRTFIGGGQRPIRENILHLLDYNSPGNYTLYYQAAPGADLLSPVSRMAPLPADSYGLIPVSWSGADDAGGSGLAFFDVYVSQDGGPFGPWLQHVSQRSATFAGTLGSQYAFYCRATDVAGNVEAAPTAPQAATTASLVNHAPSLPTNLVVTLDEGQTLVLTNSATDADRPAQTLTYGLGPEAPLGMSLETASGRITWATGEATGPSTNVFAMTVGDNGLPSLSATGGVTVIVREINTAPFLAVITNRVINEGFVLLLTNSASDFDQPANRLTYSLGGVVPAGATLNSTNGLLRWQPTDTQGPSTNVLTVIVTDNGAPPLAGTQQFLVVVRDSNPDFVLSLGATNLYAGETNDVLVTLNSSLELSEVVFDLEAPDARLTHWTLSPTSSELNDLTLSGLGADRYRVSLVLKPAEMVSGSRALARLGFAAVRNAGSAIVPLRVANLVGVQAAGQPVANWAASDGRVIVVDRQPLVDAGHGAAGQLSLVLYGLTNTTYVLQASPELELPQWSDTLTWPLTNRFQLFSIPPGTIQPARFFRAREW